jgi:uncharacterized membrane protein YidH (DUF202 family)
MTHATPGRSPDDIPDDMEDIDPGLARERTSLAWTRSTISFAALGVLIIKYRPVVGVPVLILSAVIWEVGNLRKNRSAPRRVLIVTIAVATAALVGLILTLIGPPSHGLRL